VRVVLSATDAPREFEKNPPHAPAPVQSVCHASRRAVAARDPWIRGQTPNFLHASRRWFGPSSDTSTQEGNLSTVSMC